MTTLFQQYYKGSFTSTLHWEHLDKLWEKIVSDLNSQDINKNNKTKDNLSDN